jgi:hypothetical protein
MKMFERPEFMFYVLDGHEPKGTNDPLAAAAMFDDADARQVGLDRLFDNDVVVSTVFTGINYNWHGGPPILFETMIFGGEHDRSAWRYHTWEVAANGHKRVVEALKAGKDPDE